MAVPRPALPSGTGGRLSQLPEIEPLPLHVSEQSIRPLPISSDAPRTLGLRRIHLLNHGASTFLRGWEVWMRVPGQAALTGAQVVTREEWESMVPRLALGRAVRVSCADDAVRAPTNRPIKRDIPFVVDGLLPHDVSVEGMAAYVLFTDRTQRVWHYG